MLSHLVIRNFAIIEHLEIPFEEGYTVFTGETGAGKSIIVDALNLILGGRASTDVIRTDGDIAVRVGAIRLNGNGVDHNYVYRTINASGNKVFGPVNGDASPNTNVVEVEDTSTQAIYYGVSADVDDNSGGTISPGVSCLGDQTLVT